jgi:hypothetical protein
MAAGSQSGDDDGEDEEDDDGVQGNEFITAAHTAKNLQTDEHY